MDKIKNIISEYAGVPASDIADNMSLNGDLGIDSFSLICMLVALEDEFQIKIPDYELSKFQTLNDLHDYILNNQPATA